MRRHLVITVTAMVCITVLELVALWRGLDGSLLSTVVAALAGLGGYTLAQATKFKGGE